MLTPSPKFIARRPVWQCADGGGDKKGCFEFRIQQQLLTQAAQKTARISNSLYKGGSASYLEVLGSYTRYFQSELELSEARFNEVKALVQLHQVLGGGW